MNAILLSRDPNALRRVYSNELIARLEASAGLDPAFYTYDDIKADPEKFRDVTLIFATWGMPVMTAEEIRSVFPKLQCVFYSAGTVQYFARPFMECGVRIFSAWAANAVPVAEYTLAQILLANKGYFTRMSLMNAEKIKESRELDGIYPGNYEEKVGLIGVGMIGSLVAEFLKPFDLEVLVFDPFLSDEKAEALGVKKASLKEIFSTCRIVSNHLANNEKTKEMLGYDLFSEMMEYSTFINTGRGAQVREADLVRILTERPDIVALLDVTDPNEPCPVGHPFYSLPNCYLTPHIAGSQGKEVHRMAEYMEKEFLLWKDSKPCKYEVTAKMLETMA